MAIVRFEGSDAYLAFHAMTSGMLDNSADEPGASARASEEALERIIMSLEEAIQGFGPGASLRRLVEAVGADVPTLAVGDSLIEDRDAPMAETIRENCLDEEAQGGAPLKGTIAIIRDGSMSL